MIVKVIKPNLAPRDHLGMTRQLFHLLVCGWVRKPGLVGMNAESRVYEIVFLGQSDSAVHLLRTVAVADGDQGLNSGFSCSGNHLLAIGVELLAIEMCMRINKHRIGLLMWGQPPSAVYAERKLGSVLTSSPGELVSLPTSTSPQPVHPPKSQPAPVSRRRAMPPRSSRSTPSHAACAAQDWPRSPLCAQPKFPAHTLRRSRPTPGVLRSQYQSPGAKACLPWALSRRPSPVPRAVRFWRSRRSRSSHSAPEQPPDQALPESLAVRQPVLASSRPVSEPLPPSHFSAGVPYSASFQSRSCQHAETLAAPRPASCPKAVVPTPVRSTPASLYLPIPAGPRSSRSPPALPDTPAR